LAIGPVQSSFLSPVSSKSPARTPERPTASGGSGDRVELRGPPPEPATYAALRTTGGRRSELDAALEASKKQVEQFVRMLGEQVEAQGLEWGKVVRGEQSLTVDPATQKAAAAAVSEDGEWGVRKTAERILDFAKAAIGGDPEKLATIRAAVEKGFSEAEEAFGGWLPEISHRTMDAVRSEFDRWEKSGLPQ
jgi:hypothetical protein